MRIQSLGRVELSPGEYKEIKRLIERFDDATPRQIRIFYYRYLLARNLLIKRFEKMGKDQADFSGKGNSKMGDLLLWFSLVGTDRIKSMKEEILSQKKESPLHKTLEGLNTDREKDVLLEILNVMEMVIAY